VVAKEASIRAAGARHDGLGEAVIAADELLVRTLHPVLSHFNIGIDVFRALRVLATSSGLTVGELGREIGANPPATTRSVDRLVSAGHAYRRADEADRRRVLVMITDRGLDLFRDVLAEIEDRVRDSKALA